MKQLHALGIIGGAALLIAAPFSLQWSHKNVAALARQRRGPNGATAQRDENGRRQPKGSSKGISLRSLGTTVFCDVPRNPFNVGADRYRPTYISPPAGSSYYLPPLQLRVILQLPLACGASRVRMIKSTIQGLRQGI